MSYDGRKSLVSYFSTSMLECIVSHVHRGSMMTLIILANEIEKVRPLLIFTIIYGSSRYNVDRCIITYRRWSLFNLDVPVDYLLIFCFHQTFYDVCTLSAFMFAVHTDKYRSALGQGISGQMGRLTFGGQYKNAKDIESCNL